MGIKEKTKEKPLLRLQRSLTTENLWLYILSLLSKKKYHGYAIREAIEKKFGWKSGFITPYVVLYKLEAEGYISSQSAGRRVEYKITSKGRKALSKAKKLLRDLQKKL